MASPAESGFDQEYFDNYHQIPGYRLKYPDENVIRFLVSNFPADDRPNTKVLDLGCGCGRHLMLLNEFGFDAHGIDGSPWAVNYAKNWIAERDFKADIREGLIIDLPYENATFDCIIEHATLVTNNWDDILSATRECARVLKDGGIGFFLLKTRRDCAFIDSPEVAHNTFLVDEGVYMSRASRDGDEKQTFRAFDRADIDEMFDAFSSVNVHTWDTSFKSLEADAIPDERLTSYWIVIVRK
jgi:SAM-dependent methyltransferase